jgi:hypothetical protein
MGIKVTSTLTCFFHGRRYRPGEQFELPDGVKPAASMQVVDDKAPAKPKAAKPKADAPQTFSQIAKQDAKGQDVKGIDDLV